jgi:hypothetical protein
MDAKTLEALEGSIAKWQAIVAGTGTDKGAADCPLCQIFIIPNSSCKGCPVYEKTKYSVCKQTPYTNQWLPTIHSPFMQVTEEQRIAAAQAELDFLISLLPNEERKETNMTLADKINSPIGGWE